MLHYMAAEWEYDMTVIDDESGEVNRHMAMRAQDGWDLVNATSSSYYSTVQPGNVPIIVWHTRYATFWRRPVPPTPPPPEPSALQRYMEVRKS